MYKLVAVTGKNFLSFGQFQVNVAKPGVWLITGYNMLGGDSNGSGKSAIFSAISWALYGRTSKGSMSDIGNWGGGTPEVEVTFNGPTGLVSVYRSSTKIEIRHENGDIVGGNKLDVQKAINDMFKADYAMFINSTLWAQGSTEFLAASGDVDKKKLLKAIMGLEVLDKGAEKVKRLFDEAIGEADKLSMDLSRLESRILEIEAAEQMYSSKAEKWEKEHQTSIHKMKIALESATPPDPTGSKEQLHEKDSIYQKMSAQVDEKKKELAAYTGMFTMNLQEVASRSALKTQIDGQIDQLVSQDGGTCPYCGSEITRKNLGKHKRELTTKLKEAEERVKVAEEAVYPIQEKINELQNWVNAYETLRGEIIQLSTQYEIDKSNQKHYESVMEMMKKNLKAEEESVNPFTDLKPDQSSVVLKGQLEIGNKNKEAILSRIDYLAYVKWLLSREGVSSYIIEQSFARLEHLTNFYLSKLCTEGFRVQIKPQRELKSKALKEEIDIAVFTGKHNIPYWNLSDGQRQRLNIALLVGVYRLCRDYGQARFDFLLLDEVLDLSIGQKGQEDVLRFMKELLAEVESIYIISHKEGISSDFDHEISIVRDMDGVSKVVSHG